MVSDRPRVQSATRSSLRAFASLVAVFGTAVAAAEPSSANNLGENSAWQFRTSADKANQAAVLDLIARRRSGYYAAPIYTTNIARQVNCSIGASAVGNNNGQSSVANSPSVTGATATSTGNSNRASVDTGQGDGSSSSTQGNSGQIVSGVSGGTGVSVRGDAWQALNSSQSNSGSQSASVQNSNACALAALN